MIGLCGAHRVGKSTLAEAFARQQNIPFVRTDVAGILRTLGVDPKADISIEGRLATQEAILYGLTEQYKHAESLTTLWITDRTPIDLASYMLADVQRATMADNPELAAMVNRYVDRCIEVANAHFATIVLVNPGIQVVEAEGKAPGCPAYMEHLTMLQAGLMLREDLRTPHFMLPRSMTDLQARVKAIGSVFMRVMERHGQTRPLGEPLH